MLFTMVSPALVSQAMASPEPKAQQAEKPVALMQAEFFLFLANSVELDGELTTPMDLVQDSSIESDSDFDQEGKLKNVEASVSEDQR